MNATWWRWVDMEDGRQMYMMRIENPKGSSMFKVLQSIFLHAWSLNFMLSIVYDLVDAFLYDLGKGGFFHGVN